MRRFVIIAGGKMVDYQWHAKVLQPGDYIICADGGANHAVKLGVVPHLVIGDMDSIDPRVEDSLRSKGCEFRAFPREKDKTDTQLALEEAVLRGAGEILLLGALGDRLDHTLANILLLIPWSSRGIRVRLVDENHEAQVVTGPASFAVMGETGDTVSLLPLTPTVKGIDLEGFYYPLSKATLRMGETTGISNELVAPTGRIKLETGTLLVALTRKGTS
ncbi:hypothetical protein SY88_14595 [Clostridiales bacterium PH28_bin88]|nr:hypothetical protein SY88_14595 [Clostridiales bacterium PH28_bin88]